MSDLVVNPEDRFSRIAAHFVLNFYIMTFMIMSVVRNLFVKAIQVRIEDFESFLL